MLKSQRIVWRILQLEYALSCGMHLIHSNPSSNMNPSAFLTTRDTNRPVSTGLSVGRDFVHRSLAPPAAEQFARLTPRQQMVARKLLAGLPRKTIARQLGITLDTVGDHLKAIYKHFGVCSSTELAALFLRFQ